MGKKIILSNVALRDASKSRLLDAIKQKDMEFFSESEITQQRLPDVEVLILGGKGWLTKERLEKMPGLKMIQSISAGVEHLNFELIPERITVCGNVGAYAEPMAEYVFGALICLARDLLGHDQRLKAGIFEQAPPGLFLKGRTICVIGTGGIGQTVAKVAKTFGMLTSGINTSGHSAPYFDRVGTIDSLGELLRGSDVVVVALPLTVATKDLIGEKELSLLKPDCILINVARGAIINQKALYEFLLKHPGVKAALDVWWKYPQKGQRSFSQDYPITNLPNVLASPHFSDGVKEFFELGSEHAVNNVLRYLKKESLKGVAIAQDYYGLYELGSHP